MRIAELVESLDLPQTRAAERAWDDGRRRVRRRRGGLAATAAGLAVASVVGVVVLTGGDHHRTPAPTPAPTTSSPTGRAPVVQRLVVGGAWRSLVADFPLDRLPGFGNLPPLVSDPVSHAALVMTAPGDDTLPLVLGAEDHLWRQVQRPRLVPVRHSPGYLSPVVRPGSLSPDATLLAIPQPDALVVVDLTDGSHRTYDVPGKLNTFVTWVDSGHVLVVQGGARHGVVVDLTDGSIEQTTYGPTTAFLGGDTLTWAPDALHSDLRWGDGRVVPTDANNAGGFSPEPPLVRNDVVVGVMCVCSGGVGLPFTTWGIVAVDGSTGKVLAYLPLTHTKGTRSLLLGWDGDNPVIGLSIQQSSGYLYVFSWDWRHGELRPIVRVGDCTSWGTGQVQ
jgi:hypothetical protein